MQATSQRAVARHQFDPFRAIECAREARFDHLHAIKPVPSPVSPQPARRSLFARLLGV